ncbi:nonribosomal peptide synthetase 14 [Aspergillus awamori]|uniref:Nonribosomal peptide synthetase 14 n=1 Tax=Aspergillus awamori TaxID=105351 RepID=A0A401KJ86_ASPAW|nr:nonribosomal peptide synthetase 14 [Aspergillus awamori]
MNVPNEPIAIVGSACRFPGGCDTPSKLWEMLKQQRDVIKKIPKDRFNTDALYHPEPTHHGTSNAQYSYLLEQDIGEFDANFFNIHPKEAECIDPQQRVLLETVYDGISAAGLPMEKMRGSDTAVYVGQMCDDWAGILQHQVDEAPPYTGTGTSRSIMANRVSYFFDWHGPCMNIDTACSSSLVAVHEAVQTLRSGHSAVAVAAGVNFLIHPMYYVSESNLRMLSTSGRCRMWDASGDGYGRGEGIACVVLKTLSQAQKDNDHIECIIRETGVNQDGRTSGITMPSNIAQAQLIRDTYRRAGLDVRNPLDQPQFFHAHGTGTKAGDPQEATAIYRAFFTKETEPEQKLLVGSIKTHIGHTEGAAGLASVISTSLALQHGEIFPNMHFNELNPDILPYYGAFEVPTSVQEWPALKPGQVRRASVNSFGFGGTNTHAILEAYIPSEPTHSEPPQSSTLYTPLLFSASSANSLREMITKHLDYLVENPETSLRDLAWTLQHHRSTLPFRKAITGSDYEKIVAQMHSVVSTEPADLKTRFAQYSEPRILAVFTGQGAQWPQMGARLLQSSSFVRDKIAFLDECLATLPEGDRPDWALTDQILAAGKFSRVTEAAISQPLCTAVQIVLVDLLQAAGIKIGAVVGHSSGKFPYFREIGAAYAAGFLSACDAIRVAYLRGVCAKLAASPSGSKGSMAAIGASAEEAHDLCNSEKMKDRITVAALNSGSSVTLSGDEDAINAAVDIFSRQGKFARRLRVDTAYHSAHMQPCVDPYLKAMERCGVSVQQPLGDRPTWFSSVYPNTAMSADTLTTEYWVHNMVQAVLFSPALITAAKGGQPFDMGIEVGPHPALKGPALDSLGQIDMQIPYTGLFARGEDDVDELSAAMGFLWTQLGSGVVNFDGLERALNSDKEPKKLLVNLPSYPFDHQNRYWAECRTWRADRLSGKPPNPLLGSVLATTRSSSNAQWKNILKPTEIPWLQGHRLQNQLILPATAYIVMALEAITAVAGDAAIALFRMTDVLLRRAIVFNDDNSSVECISSLQILESNESRIRAKFTVESASQGDLSLRLNVESFIEVELGGSIPDKLPLLEHDQYYNINEQNAERFYSEMQMIGYHYSPPFRGISSIHRRLNFAHGTLIDQSGDAWEDQLILHPGMLDTAVQTIIVAYSAPQDGRLWSLHVPTRIASIEFNPHFAFSRTSKQELIRWESNVADQAASVIEGSFHLLTQDRKHSFLQAEGIVLSPFSPAQAQDDNQLLGHMEWQPAIPNADMEAAKASSALDSSVTGDVERMALYYLRKLCETSTEKHRNNALPHHQQLLRWASSTLNRVSAGKHPFIAKEWISDSEQQIQQLARHHHDSVEARLVAEIGSSLPYVVQEQGVLAHYISMDEEAPTIKMIHERLANLVKQINHRYAHMNILEIGSGTGAVAEIIVPSLGTSFSSYTFTDVSDDLFSEAEFRFGQYADRMVFRTLDIQQDLAAQGFIAGKYDLVLVGNNLQMVQDQEKALSSIRQLLKPGGYLIGASPITDDSLRLGIFMSDCPEWWAGADAGRMTLDSWGSLLRQCQFSGIDTCTPVQDALHDFPVWAAQAVDERVRLLRDPLAASPEFPEEMPHLVIIGGKSMATVQLIEQISTLLSTKYSNVTRFPSLEALNRDSVPPKATVLSLADLDGPVMKSWTLDKLEALKALWDQAAKVLWVTKGAYSSEPYSSMIAGIARVVRAEKIELNVQLLDIAFLDQRTASLVSETLLRHHFLLTWSPENSTEKLLWSYENEVAFDGQQMLIPRVRINETENLRMNSARRSIVHEIDPSTAALRLVSSGESYQLEEVSSLRVAPTLPTIRVRQSLLQFLKLGSNGSFMLCIGTKQDHSQATVLAVTQTAESLAPVEPGWTIEIPTSLDIANLALVTVATHIISQQILAMVPYNGTLVVHEPDKFLYAALSDAAEKSRINVWFTTCQPGRDSNWTYLHPALPARLVKERLPSEVSAFINFESPKGPGSRVAEAIAGCMPPHGVQASATTLFTNQLYTRSGADPTVLSKLLHDTWQIASSSSLAFELNEPIPLGEVSCHNPVEEAIQLVDWDVPVVPVHLRQIDNDPIFRRDRTYLMIGLTGEVGQSLCHWMARKGAGFIVLASRNPKVTPAFLQKAEDLGATVRSLSLDITSRNSLQRCLREIRRSMPPIAGVANGAMIMEDVLFDDLEFESMERSMKPKVLGSKLLDEAFYDTPLDFFIMFSSVAGVVGNTGQGTYAAANMYMAGLALKRRKRGVVGSAIAYSPLMGLGYINRTDETMGDKFRSMGISLLSETDFHYAFAEAIKEGQAKCHDRAELITGCSPMVLADVVRGRIRSDIRFSHLNLERTTGKAGSGSGANSSVKAQLQQASSLEEVQDIILGSFTARLKSLLRMSSEQSLDVNSSLVDQGIDSLVAIDIREWFGRELEVDMPVIRILGGSSIAVLIEDSLQYIPKTVLDLNSLSGEGQNEPVEQMSPAASATEPQKKPAATLDSLDVEPSTSFSDHKDSGSSSSDSESVDTPSNYGTSDTEPDEENTYEPLIDIDLRQSTIQSATEKIAPMSFNQARFWFMQHALQDPSALNMAHCWHVEGSLDLPRLRKAVTTVGDRHEAMRTRFFWGGENHNVPMQGILSRCIVQLEIKRIANKEEVYRELDAMRHHTYDLNDWQLVRTRLLTLSDKEHYMIIGNHQITFDGNSASLLLNEMNEAYLGQSLPMLSKASQYSSFAEKQLQHYSQGYFQEHVDYFKSIIHEDNPPLELFSFATAKSRPVQSQYRTHRSDMLLSPKQTSLLNQVSQKIQSKTFDIYTAVLGVLLFRLLPNIKHVLIGIDANRSDLSWDKPMGCVLNTLPIRLDRPETNTKLGPFLGKVRDAINGVLEHSSVPFDVLVNELKLDRSANCSPVFQVMIQHRIENQDRVTWCNATRSRGKSLKPCTGFDLHLEIVENAEGNAVVSLETQQGLYSQEHTDLLVKTYVNLLEQLTTIPEAPLEAAELWSSEDTSMALRVATGPVAPMRWPQTVVHRIDQMVQQYGSKPALKDGSGKILTYNDMGRRVDSIIAALRQAGAPKGSIIAAMQEPGVDSICSMLAVFRAGAVYMPLDTRISTEQIKCALQSHKPVLLLVDQATSNTARSLQDLKPKVLNASSVPTRKRIQRAPNLADGNSAAAILFTGGSASEPKGVLINHASMIAQLEASSMQYNFSDERPLIALQHSDHSIGLSLTQAFDALCNGGSLVILSADKQGDPIEIAKTVREENISYTLATPSEYQSWLSNAAGQLQKCPHWTLAAMAGGEVSHKLLQSFRSLESASLQLLNLYISPGTCFGSTWQGRIEYRRSDLELPLAAGYPSPNQAIYIVDTKLRPLPIGVPGEVIIGGAGVTSGYVNPDAATKGKFIESPFSHLDTNFTTNKWTSVYRTGDYGYLRKDGSLVLVGRSNSDTHVNVRGFQVEPAEIENALVEAAGGLLADAVVTLREHDEDQFLAAHVVFTSQVIPSDSEEFLDNLRMRLPVPEYMVPSAIVPLAKLPLNAHSEVDRLAIHQLPLDESNVVTWSSREMTPMEASLAEVWQGILPASGSLTLTPSSDFFKVGGTSLLIVILQRAIKMQYKVALPVIEFVTAKRLADMALLIESKGAHA